MKGRRTIRAWAVLFWLLLWQAGAMAIDQRIILVSPLTVLARLTELVPTLDFWGAIGYSLVRITAGFLLGVAAGTLLAALSARFRRVLPYFRSACGSALGLCWKSGIAAEVIGMPDGSIGEQLQQAKIYLNTPDLFAWTLVIVLVSLVFEKVFLILLKWGERTLERM